MDAEKSTITVNDLLEKYINETLLRPASIRQYRLVVDLFVRAETNMPAFGVDRATVIHYRNNVLARASAVTWNNYRRHLRVLWNFGFHRQIVNTNPFTEIRPAPEARKRKKTINVVDLKKVITFLQNEASKSPSDQNRLKPIWFWLIVVQLIYATGIRRRQLVELRWGHLDLTHGTLLLVAEGSKNYREWSVPVPTHLIESLKTLQQKTMDLHKTKKIDSLQIFNVTLFNQKYKGDRMTVSHVSIFFRRLSDATGIRIATHRLRHTIATELANHPNVNMKSVQELLGHTDLRTTLEYYVETNVEHMRTTLEEITLKVA